MRISAVNLYSGIPANELSFFVRRRFFSTSPPARTTTNAFGVRLLPEHLRGRLFGPKEIAERSTNNAKYKVRQFDTNYLVFFSK